MRDLTDTLTRGPFRDDTHRAAVDATAVDLSQRPLAKLRTAIRDAKQCRTYELHETPPWASQGDQRATRVEAEDGRVRASQAELPEVDITPEGIHIPVSLAWQGAAWDLDRIYDAATRALASAGPLPLAGTEPYSEPNGEFSLRIGVPVPVSIAVNDVTAYLDGKAAKAGLPRACLVPATTKEGI